MDGNPSTFYHSVDPTNLAWVQIELQNEVLVQHVQITIRINCCWKRFSNVEIRVGNENANNSRDRILVNQFCNIYEGHGTAKKVVIGIDCIKAVSGRYITIQILDDSVNVMNLAEVEVFGKLKGRLPLSILQQNFTN